MDRLGNVRLVSIVVASLLVVSVVHGQGLADPELVPFKELPGGGALNLHVFNPTEPGPQDGRPAVVFFFGGGWVGGKPKQFYPQCRHLAKRGMVAIAAEYRIKSVHDSTVPQSVADAKSAIRYVRQHAAKLGIDPEKIISAGGSAGGHLAASTGTLTHFDEPDEDSTISSVPNAMILLNPVVDTTPTGYTGKQLPKEGDKTLSPIHHIRADLPPPLSCHGTADKAVPHENVVRFEKAMNEAGNRCELKSFEGAAHGFFNPRPKSMDHYYAVVAHMDAFIDSLGW